MYRNNQLSLKKNYINKNITKLETFGSTYIYEINDLYVNSDLIFLYGSGYC